MRSAQTKDHSLTPVVHGDGRGRQLDRIYALVKLAMNPRPLTECIDELTRRLADVFAADVCSVYLREGDDLVMRGNIGFPAAALTGVRLSIGEGITGMAVECMRPISISVARDHASYRHFPELREEHFPIFVAVPLAGSHGPLGALVLQRRDPPPFSVEEIDLAVALTAPICAAVERSRLVGDEGAPDASHHRARRVTLTGRRVVRGRAFGRCMAVRRIKPAQRKKTSPAQRSSPDGSLERVIAAARRMIVRQQRRVAQREIDVPMLSTYRSILDDARLQQRLLELCRDGASLLEALAAVSAEAARAATRSGDDYTIARAQAIADISEVLSHLLSQDGLAPPRGTVLVAERLTIFELILSQPAGIVLSAQAIDSTSHEVASAIDVPTIANVPAVYRWVSDGDTVVVDADHGLLRVNPSHAEIARIREEQRRPRPAPPRDGV